MSFNGVIFLIDTQDTCVRGASHLDQLPAGNTPVSIAAHSQTEPPHTEGFRPQE
jgi:hypothetical protein